MDPMQRLRAAPRRTVRPAKDVRGGATVQSHIVRHNSALGNRFVTARTI